MGVTPGRIGIDSSSFACRTRELIGTIGWLLPIRTFPEGLMALPLVRAVITWSGDIAIRPQAVGIHPHHHRPLVTAERRRR